MSNDSLPPQAHNCVTCGAKWESVDCIDCKVCEVKGCSEGVTAYLPDHCPGWRSSVQAR